MLNKKERMHLRKCKIKERYRFELSSLKKAVEKYDEFNDHLA